LVAGFLKDLTRSRGQLIAENALLQQQLIVASRKVKRPLFKDSERGLLVLLSRIVHGWQNAVLLVKPETILRWHREGLRLFWRWKSRARKPAEPKISAGQIALIRRMAEENRLWGAERIRGELLKLGISVAKRTLQRYRRRARPPTLPHGQSSQDVSREPYGLGLRFLASLRYLVSSPVRFLRHRYQVTRSNSRWSHTSIDRAVDGTTASKYHAVR